MDEIKQKLSFIDTIKRIVEKKQFMKYKKQSIDLFSASIVLNIYEALNEINKEKLNKMGTEKPFQAIQFCFKLNERCQ